MSTDDRYYPIEPFDSSKDYVITREELQSNSGVLAILNPNLNIILTQFRENIFAEDYDFDQLVKLKMYQRPTINWDIECEETIPRQEAYDFFEKQAKTARLSYRVLKKADWPGWPIVIGPIILLILGGYELEERKDSSICLLTCFGLEILTALIMIASMQPLYHLSLNF